MSGSNHKKRIWRHIYFLLPLLFVWCPTKGHKSEPSRKEDRDPPVRSVVSLSPSITEIVAEISGIDILAGVTTFCNYPEGVERIEKVGGWINPNIEKIVLLNPDIVIGVESQWRTLEKLKQLGIRSLMVRSITLEDILESYVEIGKALGFMEGGLKLKRMVEEGISKYRGSSRSGGGGRRGIIVVGRESNSLRNIYAVSKGSYISELFEIAGGENIVDEGTSPFTNISIEFILRKNPDLIIEFSHGSEDGSESNTLAPYMMLSNIEAVRRHNIYLLKEKYPMIPGVRLLETVELFRNILEKKMGREG